MLTSISLKSTQYVKNDLNQPQKMETTRRVRAEEIPISNKTATELGTLGFNQLKRFKCRFVAGLDAAKVTRVTYRHKDYKVSSIKDDGSGRFVIVEVHALDD